MNPCINCEYGSAESTPKEGDPFNPEENCTLFISLGKQKNKGGANSDCAYGDQVNSNVNPVGLEPEHLEKYYQTTKKRLEDYCPEKEKAKVQLDTL